MNHFQKKLRLSPMKNKYFQLSFNLLLLNQANELLIEAPMKCASHAMQHVFALGRNVKISGERERERDVT